jgi:hypothetical protein
LNRCTTGGFSKRAQLHEVSTNSNKNVLEAMFTLYTQNYNVMQSKNRERTLTIRDIWARAMSSNNRAKILPEFKTFWLIYTRVFATCYFRQYMPNNRPVLCQQPQRSKNPILTLSPEEGITTSQNWDDVQKYHSKSLKIYLFLKTFRSFFITTTILFFILHI